MYWVSISLLRPCHYHGWNQSATDHTKHYYGVRIIGLDLFHLIMYYELLNPVASGIPVVKKNGHKCVLFQQMAKLQLYIYPWSLVAMFPEVETELPSYCLHFLNQFRVWKLLWFDRNFTEIFFFVCYKYQAWVGSYNGLVWGKHWLSETDKPNQYFMFFLTLLLLVFCLESSAIFFSKNFCGPSEISIQTLFSERYFWIGLRNFG